MKAVELYYSVRELSFLLRFSVSYLRQQLRKGEFGPLDNILDVDGDLRVPASAVNFFLERHKMIYDPGVKARNLAEMRRKLNKEDTNGRRE